MDVLERRAEDEQDFSWVWPALFGVAAVVLWALACVSQDRGWLTFEMGVAVAALVGALASCPIWWRRRGLSLLAGVLVSGLVLPMLLFAMLLVGGGLGSPGT